MNIVKKNKRGMILFVAFLVLFCAGWLFYQSELVKDQADRLLKYGRAEEAILLYKKAQSIFPLRRDIADDIAGARLVVESSRDYERIAEFAELQEVPPLSNLPVTRLNPNELFVPVLMYHHIRVNPRPGDPVWAALNVSAEQLNQQLNYFAKSGYHAITLDELGDALDGKISLPANPIILTFDDGYRNFYENAFPLLKKYHMKAVEFVVTKVVNLPPYLTWDEIVEMDKSGLVEFGAHTRHHPNLPDISQKDVVDEIRGSKRDLEEHLHKHIFWFAYPYGSYSAFIMKTVKEAGFKGAASTVYGAVQSRENLYLFPRIMVDGRFSLDNIARRVQR